jgi:hypothetical protein
MALTALVISTCVVATSTERVTVPLVITSAVAWAFVPLIQLGTGMWLVRGAAPGRRLTALESYFETHRPWSLFILAFHALMLAWPASRGFALLLAPTALVPIALTVRGLTRMCRETLDVSPGRARRMVMLHQLMTYLVVLAYAGWASAYVPRLVSLIR